MGYGEKYRVFINSLFERVKEGLFKGVTCKWKPTGRVENCLQMEEIVMSLIVSR